jgi:ketosteroid isomerase-like protein
VGIGRHASDEGERGKGGERNASGSNRKNVEVITEIFEALEQRDERRFNALCAPDFEIVWPASLPYGVPGVGRYTWSETWNPLQPTDQERRMDPRVVAASGDEVVVLWRQKGVSAAGERFDAEVLGLYRLREGKLARAQMFYFDTAAVAAFLAKAKE